MSSAMFVCFTCRATRRLAHGASVLLQDHTCQFCQGTMPYVYHKFAVPGKTKTAEWRAFARKVAAYNRELGEANADACRTKLMAALIDLRNAHAHGGKELEAAKRTAAKLNWQMQRWQAFGRGTGSAAAGAKKAAPVRPKEKRIAARTQAALTAIRSTFDTPAGAVGSTRFVAEVMRRVAPAYWHKHLGVKQPAPQKVLGLLVREEDDDDDMESLSFTLPGAVTDYVLTVTFDEAGKIADICMQS